MDKKSKKIKMLDLSEVLASENPFFKPRASYFKKEDDKNNLGRRACDKGEDLRNLTWVPDWRNKDHYQNLVNVDKQNLAWEFLRRNKNYQTVCDDLLRYKNAHKIEWRKTFLPEDVARIKLSGLLCGGGDWFENLFGVNSYSPYYEDAIPKFIEANIALSYCLSNEGCYDNVIISDLRDGLKFDGEVMARFNIHLSIDNQISKFREEISKIKTENNIPKKKNKDGNSKVALVEHLRVLDAIASSKNLDHVNEIIGPMGYNGKNTAANKAIETATKIADMGYRSLLA